MFSVIDISSHEKMSDLSSLPSSCLLPDGGLALLTEIGQEVPDHAPAFRVAERVVVSEAPTYPHIVVSESEEFANGRIEVSQTYAPDAAAYKAALEVHVDAVAAERQYSGGVSIATYASSTIPQWEAEAVAFIAWRDAVWAHALTEMSKVQQGQRTPPTIETLIGELPVIAWPE